MSATGTLYGIGVGPGDPELLTLKSLRLIKAAAVIAYPAATGIPSFARAIVAEHLTGAQREIAIEMPMVAARFPAQNIYAAAATEIAECLSAGQDVAVLCEGDPMFYGSFMYLHARLAGRFETVVVPGVSSLMACAAMSQRPLAARNERLHVLVGPLDEDELTARMLNADAVAIMKVGRHLAKVKRALATAGMLDQAVYIERATLPSQRVVPVADLAEDSAPYFSMILARRSEALWPQEQ